MKIIHRVRGLFAGTGGNYELLFLGNDYGRFALQWSDNYTGGLPQRWDSADKIIDWALWEMNDQSKHWIDTTAMANFILGYFPVGEVILAALGQT